MNDFQLLHEIYYPKAVGFGVKCSKFTGALTIEVLRLHLKRNGIPVSRRDVFIKGVGIEVDLIIPRPGGMCQLF